jgi:PKD repeat protein
LKRASGFSLLGVLLLLLCLVYPVSAIGIFRPSTGYWYFDFNLDGIVDNSFRYGGSTDQIIQGDWNGDGKDGIAIFRPSSGYWYFDYNLDGIVDKSFRYGGITDRIIVGKWNSTLQDGIAIFRPSTGYWYFDYNLDGIVDKSFRYGGSTDQIIQGDWNGDGKDGIAIFRPSTGYWYFDYNLDGIVDKSFRYGGSTDQVIAGKWISIAPVAAFTSDVQSGNVPLTVMFTDSSNGTTPLIYAWDFTNEGLFGNTSRNPHFTYSTPGTYTVKLTVTNSVGNDSEIKNGYITVREVLVAPTADFFTNKRSGTSPLTVRFTDSSNGTAPLTYAWDFTNDGDEDSYLKDPMFTYDEPGTYTVKLTVTNSVGTDIERKTGYITVTEGEPGGSHAGVALTFDDKTIDQWFELRDLLQQNNTHVTFFVTLWGNDLDQDAIEKLRTLQEDGHEIAFHGYNHVNANAYLENHSIQQYLDYEIIPGIDVMNNAGFYPVDFAYPFGSENDTLTAALQANFVHVRGTDSFIDDPFLYAYGSNQLLIEGTGIDDLTYGNTINDIYDAISNAKQEDKILILYAHEPVQTVTENYTISHDRIEKILINVSQQDMKFYTVSELT